MLSRIGISYDYDQLGRQTQDRVTTLGTGVDGSVRRIATTYEVRGMRETVTSYDDTTVGQGNIVNEVRFAYNDFGQLTADYQSHSGDVNLMNTPKVQYAYADGSENTIRPTALTYPNGRVLTYDYGTSGGTDDAASRVASLIDDDVSATHLVDYSYLGRDTFVEVDYTEPDLKYTLVGTAGGNDPETGDIYRGLDRFGRVKDSYWYDYGSATDVDRIQYGYDRAGNRLWRKNTVAATLGKSFDELYTYDGLHRLADMQRGTLNANRDAVTNLQFAECWQLDETGNWQNFRQDADGDGTWDLEQSRTANPVNEITGISETAGPAWATPAYSRAGNMTTIPQPADPTTSYTATYDPWNRLIKLEEDDGSSGLQTVAEYEYGGRNFRIIERSYATGSLDEIRHYYYTSRWQVLEERLDSSPDSADAQRQFVWGRRYIDDLACRDRDTSSPTDGNLDERLYVLQDANWNVTTLCNTSASVEECCVYSAYGEPNVLTSSFVNRPSSHHDWKILYTGRRFDITSMLCQYRNRYYNATLGRFISRDPVIACAMHSMHLALYVGANPISGIDPLGLCNLNTLVHIIDSIRQHINAQESLPYVFPHSSNNPYQHCVWNCRMTRERGEEFAREMSRRKEAIDRSFADIGRSMSDQCWNLLPESWQEWIAGSACSADQPSDFQDNETGRECGRNWCLRHLSCEECCGELGVGKDTKEGPGTDRKYGPHCDERFRKELEDSGGSSWPFS